MAESAGVLTEQSILPPSFESNLSPSQKATLERVLLAIRSDHFYVTHPATRRNEENFLLLAQTAAQTAALPLDKTHVIDYKKPELLCLNYPTVLLERNIKDELFRAALFKNESVDISKNSPGIQNEKKGIGRLSNTATRRSKKKPKIVGLWEANSDSLNAFLRLLRDGNARRQQIFDTLAQCFKQLQSFCTLNEKAWKHFAVVRTYALRTQKLHQYAFNCGVLEVNGPLAKFLQSIFQRYFSMPARISDESKAWLQTKKVVKIFLNPQNSDLRILLLEIVQKFLAKFIKAHVTSFVGDAETTIKEAKRQLFLVGYQEIQLLHDFLLNGINYQSELG
ncbi:unnamed protein product, partial [Mesorhabditis belari]|uniref:Uncharacterized protein n=1 Tax=Mesorhabditis belari TaxID=2138241 RepID=A0AAF3FII2_9BILA